MSSRGLIGRIKDSAKNLVFRVARPGLRDVNGKLDGLEGVPERLRQIEDRLGLIAEDRQKYQSELEYWRYFVRGGAKAESGESFEDLFGRWTRNRIVMLGQHLGLEPGDDAGAPVDDWCAARSAVELGAGPYPTLSAARKGWLRAVAVDPLARQYVEEGLVSRAAQRLVFLESRGESIPLPSGSADLVICENCLDHVSDPEAVVHEMHRLLKPGGYLWFFVDLSNHRDQMHPHALNEQSVRRLLGEFEEVRATVSDHKAHPEAYGSLRGLFRRPEVVKGLDESGAAATDRNIEVRTNRLPSATLAQSRA